MITKAIGIRTFDFFNDTFLALSISNFLSRISQEVEEM